MSNKTPVLTFTEPIPTNVFDMLEQTAQFIERNPWGRGGIGSRSYSDKTQREVTNTCPCLLESLAIVGGRSPKYYGRSFNMTIAELEAFEALEERALVEYGCATTDMNDRTRDKRKVVRFVRRTARHLAQQRGVRIAA